MTEFDSMLQNELISNKQFENELKLLVDSPKKLKKQPPQQQQQSAALTPIADQIQYTAEGRPKLIVSIELDLFKILNTQFGVLPDPYMDEQMDQRKQNMSKKQISMSNPPAAAAAASSPTNTCLPQKTTIPAISKPKSGNPVERAKSLSKPKPSEPAVSNSSPKPVESKAKAAEVTGQSLKRATPALDECEASQRVATKKQKFLDNGNDSKPLAQAATPKLSEVTEQAATLKLKNKTTSFSSHLSSTKAGDSLNYSHNATSSNAALHLAAKSKSSSNMLASSIDKKSTPKHGQYNLDFLNSYENQLIMSLYLNLID